MISVCSAFVFIDLSPISLPSQKVPVTVTHPSAKFHHARFNLINDFAAFVVPPIACNVGFFAPVITFKNFALPPPSHFHTPTNGGRPRCHFWEPRRRVLLENCL